MSGFSRPAMGKGRRGGGLRTDGGDWQQPIQVSAPVQFDDDDGWDSGGESSPSVPYNAGDNWGGGFQQNTSPSTYQSNDGGFSGRRPRGRGFSKVQSNDSQRDSFDGRRGRVGGRGRGRSEGDGNWRNRDGEVNGSSSNRRGRFGENGEDGRRQNGFGGGFGGGFQSRGGRDRNDGQGVTMLEVCSTDIGRLIGELPFCLKFQKD